MNINELKRFAESRGLEKVLNLYGHSLTDYKFNFRVNFDGDSYTDGKNVVIGVPSFLENKEKEDILLSTKALVAHEIEHINSSDFKSLMKFKEDFYNYFKKEGDITKEVCNTVAQHLLNGLEDGRIERIVSEREPRTVKPLTYFRGLWWLNNEVKENNFLSTLFAFCSKATTGKYPKGFVESGENYEIVEKSTSLINKFVFTDNKQEMSVMWEIIYNIKDWLVKNLKELSQDMKAQEELKKQLEKLFDDFDKGNDIPQQNGNSPSEDGQDSDDENSNSNSDQSTKNNQQKNGKSSNDNSQSENAEDNNNSDNSDSTTEENGEENSNAKGNSQESNSSEKTNSIHDSLEDNVEETLSDIKEDAKSEVERTEKISKSEDKKAEKAEEAKAKEEKGSDLKEKEIENVKKVSKKYVGANTEFVSEKHKTVPVKQKDLSYKKVRKDIENILKSYQKEASTNRRTGVLNRGKLFKVSLGENKIFDRKGVNNQKSFAVYILMDASGSMSGHKYEEALDACSLLEGSLNGLVTLKIAKFNFTEKVTHSVIKDFDDTCSLDKSFSYAYKKSINKYFSNEKLSRNVDGCNFDGFSINIALEELYKRDEDNKILIVLSDGQPSIGYNTKELEKHVKEVVSNGRKNGVHIFNIMFGSKSDRERLSNDFKYMYEKNIVSCSPEQIGKNLISLMKKELR